MSIDNGNYRSQDEASKTLSDYEELSLSNLNNDNDSDLDNGYDDDYGITKTEDVIELLGDLPENECIAGISEETNTLDVNCR